MKKDYHLTIPADMGDQLRFGSHTTVKMEIRNNKLIIQPLDAHPQVSSRAIILWTVLATILSTIGFYIYCAWNKLNQVPLTGNESVATFVIFSGVVAGSLLFGGFFIFNRDNPYNHFAKRVYWRDFPIIVLSFSLILALALMGMFWVFGTLFYDASFDRFTASLIFIVFSLLVDALMIFMALRLNATLLTTIWLLVIVLGVFISMASNGQRHWWQHNLSFLGSSLAANSWQFNLTLIFSALLMIALIDYLFVTLGEIYPHSWRLLTLRLMLTLMAIDLGAVGVFPNNMASHEVHDQFARALVYFIIALIIGVRWLLPRVTNDFLALSYVMAGAMIMVALGFQVFRYLSLTAFEIIDFALAFSWLLLLLGRIQDLIEAGTTRTVVDLVESD